MQRKWIHKYFNWKLCDSDEVYFNDMSSVYQKTTMAPSQVKMYLKQDVGRVNARQLNFQLSYINVIDCDKHKLQLVCKKDGCIDDQCNINFNNILKTFKYTNKILNHVFLMVNIKKQFTQPQFDALIRLYLYLDSTGRSRLRKEYPALFIDLRRATSDFQTLICMFLQKCAWYGQGILFIECNIRFDNLPKIICPKFNNKNNKFQHLLYISTLNKNKNTCLEFNSGLNMDREYWFNLNKCQRKYLHTVRPIMNDILFNEYILKFLKQSKWKFRMQCKNHLEIGKQCVAHESFVIKQDVNVQYKNNNLRVNYAQVGILCEFGPQAIPRKMFKLFNSILTDSNKQSRWTKNNEYSKQYQTRVMSQNHKLFKLWLTIQKWKRKEIHADKQHKFRFSTGEISTGELTNLEEQESFKYPRWRIIFDNYPKGCDQLFVNHFFKVQYQGSQYTFVSVGITLLSLTDFISRKSFSIITASIKDKISSELALAKETYYLEYEHLLNHNKWTNNGGYIKSDEQVYEQVYEEVYQEVDNDTFEQEIRNYFTTCTLQAIWYKSQDMVMILVAFLRMKFFCYCEYIWNIASNSNSKLAFLFGGIRVYSCVLVLEYKYFLIEICQLAVLLCYYLHQHNDKDNFICFFINFVALNVYSKLYDRVQGLGLGAHRDNYKSFHPSVCSIKLGQGTLLHFDSNLTGFNNKNLSFTVPLFRGTISVFDS